MFSLGDFWFKVLIIFTAIVLRSGGEPLEKCFNKQPNEATSITITCGYQFIKQIGIRYQRPGQDPARCCYNSDCQWKEKCENKKSCNFTKSDVEAAIRCYLGDRGLNFRSLCIFYDCFKDEESRVLPSSGNPGNTGDKGSSSMVVVPIILVLAILIVVAAIFGFVLFRRRNQRKGHQNNSEAEPDIQGEENAGLEDAYYTIPADYGNTAQHTYNVLEKTNTDCGQKTTDSKPDDNVNYCTIVLDEDSTKRNNDYGYDRTNQKKRYEPTKDLDNDKLHSYGHLSGKSGDYNIIKSDVDQHKDKNYSFFESQEADDYSHLNAKNQNTSDTSENDYNHLQTKSRPVKRVDSYEQPILKGNSNANDIAETALRNEDSTEENEIGEFLQSKAILETNTNNSSFKRSGSYEDPMNINAKITSAGSNESDKNMKPRDDYESPISLQADKVNIPNGSSRDEN